MLLVAGAVTATAQAPFYSDDAGVTEPRHLHLELFDQWSDLPSADAPAVAQNTLVANVGYGLASTVELGCDIPWISVSNAGRTASDVAGIGDLDLYLKWRFVAGGSGRPALAVVGAVELPTGDEEKGLGSGVTDTTLNAIAEWTAVGPLDLRANAGIVFAGNTLTGEVGLRSRGRIWTWGVSATHEGTRLALGGELTGARTESSQGNARELRLQIGCRWAMRGRYTLAGAVQRGWYATPPWQLSLGVIVDL